MIDVKIKLPDGTIRRVRRVSPVQSKRGAQQFERDIRAEVLERSRSEEEPDEQHHHPPDPPPTLAEMWDEFIAFQQSPANKRPNRPRTVLENERMFRAYIEPLIGDRRVDHISARVIDRFTT